MYAGTSLHERGRVRPPRLHSDPNFPETVEPGMRTGVNTLLDVVVRERAAILELLAREDEALLVGGDALLVLDLRLDHVDGVRGLHLTVTEMRENGYQRK